MKKNMTEYIIKELNYIYYIKTLSTHISFSSLPIHVPLLAQFVTYFTGKIYVPRADKMCSECKYIYLVLSSATSSK